MKEILKLKPVFKDYLWGGKYLKEHYSVEDMDPVAEAWTVSVHPDGCSIVDGGKYDGKTLEEALSLMGNEVLGENAKAFDRFPQLIKFIDAAQSLSVQVHPSDEYALKYENQFGKTEMWYILDAKEGAGIYYGLKTEITPEEFEERIKNNTLTDVLKFIEVKKGETYFIPSGTIHAIGAGLLIAEIQQNSNATYRIYDFGRVGADGKPRELHIEKAKAVSALDVAPSENFVPASDEAIRKIAECKYFTVDEINVKGEYTLLNNESFSCVIIAEGNGRINGKEFNALDTFFVPAKTSALLEGEFKALVSSI